MANAAITNAATGSSHAAPVSWNSPTPRRVETESITQIRVSAASARMSGSPPSAIPTCFFAAASSGITISEATRIPIASGEESGVSPSIRLRTPSNVT